MLQHASEFTFDRLKFIVPSAIIISIGFAFSSVKFKSVLVVLLIIAAIQGLRSYKTDLSHYSSWNSIHMINIKFATFIQKKCSNSCAVYSSNGSVRAYANLLFHHGIYENKSSSDSVDLMRNTKSCRSIYLERNFIYPDLPGYLKAIVSDLDGNVEVINIKDME